MRQSAAPEPEMEIRRRLSWRPCHVIIPYTTIVCRCHCRSVGGRLLKNDVAAAVSCCLQRFTALICSAKMFLLTTSSTTVDTEMGMVPHCISPCRESAPIVRSPRMSVLFILHASDFYQVLFHLHGHGSLCQQTAGASSRVQLIK